MLSPLFHPLQETAQSTGWGFCKTGEGQVLGLLSLSHLPTWAALIQSCGRCGLLRLGPGFGALLFRRAVSQLLFLWPLLAGIGWGRSPASLPLG